MRRRTVVPHESGRFSRSEPFEVFTRPQRSRPARLLGLAVRLRAEIPAAVLALIAWNWLTNRMPSWVAGVLIALLVGAVALVPASRRFVSRRGLAVLIRHRLRAVFIERRVMNWSGSLPIQLWSRPTPVGERVWLVLRAGIDAGDIERILTYVASGCFARDARVTAARSMTALVVVDVIRRDPFTGPAVASPFGEPGTGRPLRVVRSVAALQVGGWARCVEHASSCPPRARCRSMTRSTSGSTRTLPQYCCR